MPFYFVSLASISIPKAFLAYVDDQFASMLKFVQIEAIERLIACLGLWIVGSGSGYLQWLYIILSVPILHYLVLSLIYHWERKRIATTKIPPTIPYAFPIVGNVFGLIWNPWTFVSGVTYHAGKQTVSGVKLLGLDVYLIQGKENIQAAWKSTSLSAPTLVTSYAMGALFGMPAKSVAMYEKDDSGIAAEPKHGSIVEWHNRIYYQIHQLFGKLLTGVGLTRLSDRFQTNLNSMIQGLEVQDDWVVMPDLFLLLQQDFTPCIIEALCGPTLLKGDSDFVATFWQFHHWLPTLSKGIPRIFARQGYAHRDKLLSAIKEWHIAARKGCQHGYEFSDFDPFWGSNYIRQTKDIFSSVDNCDDYDTMASADLSMIWAMNGNTVTAIFWTILEIFKDQELLARVRTEVLDSIDNTSSSGIEYDMHKLLQQPLLCSIYTEVLRLRTHTHSIRQTKDSNATIGQWMIPQGRFVLISTTPSHLDPEVWYKGQNYDHPIDKFWADRFLVGSGNDVRFSMERSEGSWFPYSGGSRMCPGRHFAKRAIMLTAAQFAHNFDINIRSIGSNPRMRLNELGLGVLGPADAVPFEIRRRSIGK